MEGIYQGMELAVSLLTLATLVWGLVRMFASAREARAARNEAIAASKRAASAATEAATHAIAAVQVTTAMSENLQKIELNTNSMREAAEKAASLAGEQKGRQDLLNEQKNGDK